jgi:hypothetical protein
MKSKLVSVVLSVVALATIGSAVVLADGGGGDPTNVVITSVKVQGPDNSGNYLITATGTMFLNQGDTLTGYQFYFVDPNGKDIPPVYSPPFYPPQPGKSSQYSCTATTTVKGNNWYFWAKMTWTSNGAKKSTQTNQEFSVP